MTAAIPSFIPPVAPQVPSAAPAPAPQQGFARMLSQTQKNQQAMHARPQEPAQPHKSEAHSTAPGPERTNDRANERAHERAKVDNKPGKGEKPAKAEKSEARASRTADSDEARKADEAAPTQASDGTPADPALADWLSGLQLPPAATPQTTAAGATGEAPPATDDAALQAAVGGQPGLPGKGPQDAVGRADRDAADRAQAVRDLQGKPDLKAADAVTQEPGWQAAMEHAKGQVESLAEARPVHDAHGLGALAAASHAPSAARSGEVSAPTVVSVPTPATAPEFAQSLGVQVSVLARDGVQQAELHLNPADMGPISVQIALDGTQAQVNFGADSAATRQIIESGLPELAAALRDAGFTLSGGGVHSQARGRDEGGEGGGDPQGHAGSGAIETDVTVRRSQARVSAGGLDVYA